MTFILKLILKWKKNSVHYHGYVILCRFNIDSVSHYRSSDHVWNEYANVICIFRSDSWSKCNSHLVQFHKRKVLQYEIDIVYISCWAIMKRWTREMNFWLINHFILFRFWVWKYNYCFRRKLNDNSNLRTRFGYVIDEDFEVVGRKSRNLKFKIEYE